MSKKQPTDLELLAMRAEGLVDRSIGVRFDRTSTGEALGVTSIVPPRLVAEVEATWNGARHPGDPKTPPPLLDECERLLTTAGCKVRRDGVGLVYLIEPGVSFASRVTMQRSDRSIPSWLRRANPGNWEPIEWDELVDGKLGPWVMATHEQRVVSITHTPTPLTDRSVEAGAWTDPDFRGRGYAAAVTAEWAKMLRPSGRFLFYTTDPDNLSSQRVATRLGLRFLGYQWFLRDRDRSYEGGLHPSSTARPACPSRPR